MEADFGELMREVFLLLEQGCVPRQVDAAMVAGGFDAGPLARLDDIGIDLFQACWMNGPGWSAIPGLVVAMGRLGRRTGAGFYLYTPHVSFGLRDPEIEAMIVAHSADIGVVRHEIGPFEIMERCRRKMAEGASAFPPYGVD